MLTYDQELFDYLYKKTLPDGRVIRYGREYVNLENPPRWVKQARLLSRFGLRPSDSILIVGCGFSPLVTYGRRSYGTDPSPYIQDNKHEETDTPDRLFPYAVPDPQLTGALREVGLEEVGWVITDDVLSSLEADCIIGKPGETEANQFIDGCSALGRRVVHFVTTDQPGVPDYGHPMFTYRTLAEWLEYGPDHIWVDYNTFEVVNSG